MAIIDTDTDEGKKTLAKMIKDQAADAIEEATTALAAKNRELLGEVKKLKRGETVDPAELKALEDQVDSLKTDLAAAQKESKTAKTVLEQTAKQLQDESGFTQRLLIDNGLVSELTKHGVTNAVHLKAAQAMLRGAVQIKIDGENRAATVGDKPLSDYVKEWASSDEGKFFVTAPNNQGGGSQGGSQKLGAEDLSKLSPVERINQARAQGQK